MSKENAWKSFGQLLSSPSVSKGKRRRRKFVRNHRDKIVNKQSEPSASSCSVDDFQIENVSGDEGVVQSPTNNRENEKDLLSCPSSMVLSINPPEVTSDPRKFSDSEIESVSEEDAPCQQAEASSNSSGSDDCTAIHCKRSKMTRLSFADKNNFKRRRITDDMEVTVSTKGAVKPEKKPADLQFVHKSFKPTTSTSTVLSSWKTQTGTSFASATSPKSHNLSSTWKALDKSFAEHELDCIEPLPPSPDENRNNFHQSECYEIEEIPSSADLKNANETTPSSYSFYVPSPKRTKPGKPKYPNEAGLAALAKVLSEKESKWNLWHHELMAGIIHPVMVARVESIERFFGRVVLRFYTQPPADDEGKRIENIIYLDPGAKQLKDIRIGADIALEFDERIPPHKVSLNRLVHLGVTKICRIGSIAK